MQLTDVNDNRPIFSPLEYNVTLRLDSSSSSAVSSGSGPILRLFAKDLDSGVFGQVAYRITGGNEAGIFRIDRTTGQLQVARASRLTRSAKYQLNVTATDAAGHKSILDALVTISTTNGANLVPSCDRPTYVINVKENVAQNTFIGTLRDPSVTSSIGKFNNL